MIWNYYRFCDLVVRSTFPLPALIKCSGETADVEITRVSRSSGRPSPRSMRIDVPGGQVLVTEGRRIWVTAPPDASNVCLQQYAIGPGLGTLCLQRNLLPLHASAILLQGTCVVFVGPSGVGKSTTAAMLSRSGHQVMADDLCVLQVNEAQPEVLAHSTVQSLRLREDVVRTLCESLRDARPQPDAFGKFSLTPELEPRTSPAPVGCVCVLVPSRASDPIRLEHLRGFNAFRAVVESVHWCGPDECTEYREQILRLGAITSNKVPVCRLVLPRRYDQGEELVAQVSAVLRQRHA